MYDVCILCVRYANLCIMCCVVCTVCTACYVWCAYCVVYCAWCAVYNVSNVYYHTVCAICVASCVLYVYSIVLYAVCARHSLAVSDHCPSPPRIHPHLPWRFSTLLLCGVGSSLSELQLDDTAIEAKGATALAFAMATYQDQHGRHALRRLSLRSNAIGAAGAVALAHALHASTSHSLAHGLVSLRLDGQNHLGELGARALYEACTSRFEGDVGLYSQPPSRVNDETSGTEEAEEGIDIHMSYADCGNVAQYSNGRGSPRVLSLFDRKEHPMSAREHAQQFAIYAALYRTFARITETGSKSKAKSKATSGAEGIEGTTDTTGTEDTRGTEDAQGTEDTHDAHDAHDGGAPTRTLPVHHDAVLDAAPLAVDVKVRGNMTPRRREQLQMASDLDASITVKRDPFGTGLYYSYKGRSTGSKDEAEAWLKEDVSGSVPGRRRVAPMTTDSVGAQRAAVEATGRIMHYIRKPNVLCLSFGPNV